jgi:hypothetical protein
MKKAKIVCSILKQSDVVLVELMALLRYSSCLLLEGKSSNP